MPTRCSLLSINNSFIISLKWRTWTNLVSMEKNNPAAKHINTNTGLHIMFTTVETISSNVMVKSVLQLNSTCLKFLSLAILSRSWLYKQPKKENRSQLVAFYISFKYVFVWKFNHIILGSFQIFLHTYFLPKYKPYPHNDL